MRLSEIMDSFSRRTGTLLRADIGKYELALQR